MTDKLPHNLLALFQPRPGVRYIPPQDEAPEVRAAKTTSVTGIAAFLPQLKEYKSEDDYQPTESWLQKRDRIRFEKREAAAAYASEDFKGYKPSEDPKVKGDAFKTLFVGRLSYDVKESDLEREFGRFGPIERIRIVRDERSDAELKGKKRKANRGYAFVVFEREKDLKGNTTPLTRTMMTCFRSEARNVLQHTLVVRYRTDTTSSSRIQRSRSSKNKRQKMHRRRRTRPICTWLEATAIWWWARWQRLHKSCPC